jgi:hypothetical protein
VPAKRRDSGTTEVVELRVPKESWVFHYLGPEKKKEGNAEVILRGVDVAVAPLPRMKDLGIVAFESCAPCTEGLTSQLATADPTPSASVFMTGFPGDLGLQLVEQRPLFRSGIVAMVAGERFLTINGAFVDERSFVVDRRVQPGNSGSPVFSVRSFQGTITLVGLVSATNEGWEYTIVEPASRIREAIDRTIEIRPPKLPSWHSLR